MKGRFLIGCHEDSIEGNIYANRSSLILYWLLKEGLNRPGFSLREVAKDVNVSVGLVQRVFSCLVLKGLVQTQGVRTAKRFFFKKPKLLLTSWLEQYSLIKKCKMRTYRTALSEKTELLEALKKSNLSQKVALALHSAAQAHGVKNTNLDSLELYMLDQGIRPELEEVLELEPQERGYEVLLIEPYYESLLSSGLDSQKDLKISPVLLTFLDLYHFPLRGQEQAEFMAERVPEIKRIYKNWLPK